MRAEFVGTSCFEIHEVCDFFEMQGGYLNVTSDPHIFLLTPPNYVKFFRMFKK